MNFKRCGDSSKPFSWTKTYLGSSILWSNEMNRGLSTSTYISDRSHEPRLAVVWVTPTPRAVAETGHHQQCNNLKEIPLIPAQMGGTPRTKSTGNTPSSSRLSWVISLKRFYINDIPMKALNCFGDSNTLKGKKDLCQV